MSLPVTQTGSDITGVLRLAQTRFPAPPGYDITANTIAKGVENPAANARFNFTYFTPMAWVASGFCAMRGSVRWHYNYVNPGGLVPHSITITRSTYGIGNSSASLEGVYTTLAPASATTVSQRKGKTWVAGTGASGNNAGASGMFVTNSLTQTGINVEFPMMNNYKFQYADPEYWLLGQIVDNSRYDTYDLEIAVSPVLGNQMTVAVLNRYAAIGTDFNLHFFLNAPHITYNAASGNVPV